MKRVQWAAVVGALALAVTVVACGNSDCGDCDYNPGGGGGGGGGVYDGGSNPPPEEDGGTDGGNDGGVDAGNDGGTDGGECCEPDAGGGTIESKWPNDAVLNLTSKYGIESGIQSVGIDEGQNIWLLKGREIGVLRPGDTRPTWTANIGQASQPFGADSLASGSTVICGGADGKAYVGYRTPDTPNVHSEDGGWTDFSYKQGDLDLVQLNADGTVALQEHLYKTTSTNGGKTVVNARLGIRNTNDWTYDEDRSVLTCTRVTSGPHRGDLFVGTNHGVVRVRGDLYNAHIHPVWWDRSKCETDQCQGTQKAGYTYAVSVTSKGDLLIGNDWMLGLAKINNVLADFDQMGITKFKISMHVPEINSLEAFDFWRGVTEAKNGRYYFGSKDFGLWHAELRERSGDRADFGFWNAARTEFTSGLRKVSFPSNQISQVQATDDGSVFVGTYDQGLFRITPSGTTEKVAGVSGSAVRQIVYDQAVTPSKLLVLTSSGVYMLSGH